MKQKMRIPKFKSEAAERKFWAKAKLSDYFSSADFESVSFPNLKPSSRAISLRVPEYLLMRIKERANALSIPYQSLIKEYIAQGAFKK